MTAKTKTDATAAVRHWAAVVQKLEADHADAEAMATALAAPAPGALSRFLGGNTEEAVDGGVEQALKARRRADELGSALAEARLTLTAARHQLGLIEDAEALVQVRGLATDTADLIAVLATQIKAAATTMAAIRSNSAKIADMSGLPTIENISDECAFSGMRAFWELSTAARFSSLHECAFVIGGSPLDIAAAGRDHLRGVMALTSIPTSGRRAA